MPTLRATSKERMKVSIFTLQPSLITNLNLSCSIVPFQNFSPHCQRNQPKEIHNKSPSSFTIHHHHSNHHSTNPSPIHQIIIHQFKIIIPRIRIINHKNSTKSTNQLNSATRNKFANQRVLVQRNQMIISNLKHTITIRLSRRDVDGTVHSWSSEKSINY